jgi:hypothetical protein
MALEPSSMMQSVTLVDAMLSWKGSLCRPEYVHVHGNALAVIRDTVLFLAIQFRSVKV